MLLRKPFPPCFCRPCWFSPFFTSVACTFLWCHVNFDFSCQLPYILPTFFFNKTLIEKKNKKTMASGVNCSEVILHCLLQSLPLPLLLYMIIKNIITLLLKIIILEVPLYLTACNFYFHNSRRGLGCLDYIVHQA